MNETGMRLSDWMTFHRAAQAFGQWILVRWTNRESLKYIGIRTWDPRTIERSFITPSRSTASRKPRTQMSIDMNWLAWLSIRSLRNGHSRIRGVRRTEILQGFLALVRRGQRRGIESAEFVVPYDAAYFAQSRPSDALRCHAGWDLARAAAADQQPTGELRGRTLLYCRSGPHLAALRVSDAQRHVLARRLRPEGHH